MRRSYNDPHYNKFRRAVRNRDNRCCKWPDCGKKRTLQVHHILPWESHPTLRYEIYNGITLCKKHHKMVTGHEITYARFLSSLI